MGKYYGVIGYAETVETSPGVWSEQMTERNYYGDVRKLSRRLQSSENVNDNVTINTEISVLADPFAYDNFQNIRYVSWMGSLWKVSSIDVQRPRLNLTIGGIYNV